VNEEALNRVGPQSHKKKKIISRFLNVILEVQIALNAMKMLSGLTNNPGYQQIVKTFTVFKV